MPQIIHDKLLESFRDCITQLGQLALSPFASALQPRLGDQGQHALDRLCYALDSHAAALFLRSETHPEELQFIYGHGYDLAYRETPYRLTERSFTTSVFFHDKIVNETRAKLMKSRDEDSIKFTAQCDRFLTSGNCQNVLAVPIRLADRRYGVLKAENKRTQAKNGKFSLQDEKLVELLAAAIAPLVRQSRALRLFSQAEILGRTSTSLRCYLDDICLLLRHTLDAEAASVFLVDRAGKSLMYGGGSGYKPEFHSHTYKLELDALGNTRSLTAWLFTRRKAIAATEEQLNALSKHGSFNYSMGCNNRMVQSDTLRNFIGVSLVHDSSHFKNEDAACVGVLKVENSAAARPDPFDEALACALAIGYIVPRVRKFADKTDEDNPLLTLVGEPVTYNVQRDDFKRQAVKVLRLQESREATVSQCAAYYKVAPATIHRLKARAIDERWSEKYGEA